MGNATVEFPNHIIQHNGLTTVSKRLGAQSPHHPPQDVCPQLRLQRRGAPDRTARELQPRDTTTATMAGNARGHGSPLSRESSQEPGELGMGCQLGPEGPNMLPEELKWLAITHKSFDQAKRGNNERLAMMGRMAIYMEACKTTVNSERNPKLGDGEDIHPQLRSVDNLHVESPTSRVVSSLLATAQKTDLLKVLRWKPRLTQDLEQSGVSTISSRAVQAIVGAILLQHGSEVASTVIRERILQAPRRSAA